MNRDLLRALIVVAVLLVLYMIGLQDVLSIVFAGVLSYLVGYQLQYQQTKQLQQLGLTI
jgi:hypothetical protein